jgi:hypothetical protein|tara:strand:- start:162 stop:353 length:192 start_codon:yes stop_codon:yes gene_type:complete
MRAFKNFFKPIDDTLQFDPEELIKGIQVELEHTPYKSIAKIIAKQHLVEDPQYYSNMENRHKQ